MGKQLQSVLSTALLPAAVLLPPAAIAKSWSYQKTPVIVTAQRNMATDWRNSQFLLVKTSFRGGGVEWIVRDTCKGLSCVTPLINVDFLDSDGVVLYSQLVSLEGRQGSNQRAYVKIPPSISGRTVKVVAE